MGPWFIAIGTAMMFAELARCSSDRLDAWLLRVPLEARAALLRRLQLMRSRIIEVLQAKLKFLSHIPFRAIGIFWCECGGELARCKEIAAECIAEYVNAVAAGFPVHRVAHHLFALGSSCRVELGLWIRSSEPLSAFPNAYRMLLEYALCSFVERTIEVLHAMIRRVGLAAPNSAPPSIIAKIREPHTWGLLDSATGFHRFALATWRSRNLLSDILSLRYEKCGQ